MSETLVQVPGEQLLDLLQKLDKLVELILETERSVALDVALLDCRDAAKAMADAMEGGGA